MVPFWNRTQLCQQLREIDFSGAGELSELEKRYCSYYGIDKENGIAGVSHRLGFFEALGYRLALHVYSPPRPRGTVFVLHGYFDHVGLYGHLIEHLLADGYAVVAYDQPGHGLSSGDEASIRSFAEYRQILESCIALCTKGELPRPWFAIGQSTGAAVLIETLFLRRYAPEASPFRHWVLLAPLVRPNGWLGVVLLHSLAGGFVRTWRRRWMDNSGDSEFVRFLKEKDPLQARFVAVEWVSAMRRWVTSIEKNEPLMMPVTIIQGQQDTTVDWRHNVIKLRTLLPRSTVTLLPEGRHHLVNDSQRVRSQVFAGITGAFVGDASWPAEA